MFVRGGIDALLLRTQLTIPDNTFLESNHYNEIFSTHGVIMIIFMAMPFVSVYGTLLFLYKLGLVMWHSCNEQHQLLVILCWYDFI